MNVVMLSGNLTKDVEIKSVGATGEYKMATFTIAVNKKSGDDVTTMYVPMVAWGVVAENIAKFCHKGVRIVCSGELDIKREDDGNGNKKQYPQVIVREFAAASTKNQAPKNDDLNTSATATPTVTPTDDNDDDMPF